MGRNTAVDALKIALRSKPWDGFGRGMASSDFTSSARPKGKSAMATPA
jgi:hypothetical protein